MNRIALTLALLVLPSCGSRSSNDDVGMAMGGDEGVPSNEQQRDDDAETQDATANDEPEMSAAASTEDREPDPAAADSSSEDESSPQSSPESGPSAGDSVQLDGKDPPDEDPSESEAQDAADEDAEPTEAVTAEGLRGSFEVVAINPNGSLCGEDPAELRDPARAPGTIIIADGTDGPSVQFEGTGIPCVDGIEFDAEESADAVWFSAPLTESEDGGLSSELRFTFHPGYADPAPYIGELQRWTRTDSADCTDDGGFRPSTIGYYFVLMN